MTRPWGLALWLCLAMPAAGAVPLLPEAGLPPTLDDGAEARSAQVLEDPDFGVRRQALGLDRVVEMYQWRRQGDGYERVWNSALIESTGFDADHQNPSMALQGERWWAPSPQLAGYPLDATVLRELGEWRVFRPAFSRLPLNMAATFQPDGDGLGSAENPLQPQVGDLRIRWRELVLPALHDRVAFRDGRWHLASSSGPRTAEDADPRPVASAPSPAERPLSQGWWLLAGVILLGALLLLTRRNRGGRS